MMQEAQAKDLFGTIETLYVAVSSLVVGFRDSLSESSLTDEDWAKKWPFEKGNQEEMRLDCFLGALTIWKGLERLGFKVAQKGPPGDSMTHFSIEYCNEGATCGANGSRLEFTDSTGPISFGVFKGERFTSEQKDFLVRLMRIIHKAQGEVPFCDPNSATNLSNPKAAQVTDLSRAFTKIQSAKELSRAIKALPKTTQ
jgi:hypothetical protein